MHSCDGSENSFCPHFHVKLIWFSEGVFNQTCRDPKPSKTMEALLQLCQGEEVQVSRNILLKGRTPEEDQAPPPAEGQLDWMLRWMDDGK